LFDIPYTVCSRTQFFSNVSVNHFQIALIGHCLAVADPNRSAANQSDGSRKPVLVYASTNGETRKTFEEEKKTGFRRSIPPGAALGFTSGGFDAGLGTGLMMHNNGGLGFAGTSLGIGTAGLPNNNFIGSSFGTAGLANNFVGLNGYTGGYGAFGVDGLSNPLGYRNSMVYSPFTSNMGGFGANTAGAFNQPGLGAGYYWPNRQGLMMTNNFNGLGAGGFNDPTGYSNSFGINGANAGFNGMNGFNNFAGLGSGLGSVNTLRNGANTFNLPPGTFVPQSFNGGVTSSLNGLGTGVGYSNNFGSLSNGINGFSSANSLNNRFGNGFNNGLNNFSSFNTAGVSGGFNNPGQQFGVNAFSNYSFSFEILW
jgi:hypothetical protein